jgi:putative sterol carrier protein
MPRFPSLDWARALSDVLAKDPATLVPLREWNGRSLGVVISKEGGLARDFCVYAKPHASEPKLVELKECEDEDDLELEEPDFLFRAPFSIVKQLLEKKLDPFEVLRLGKVRVEGDLKFLVPYGQKYQAIGDRALAKVETIY